ncbi:metalloregulator ArsR/SmtB family transcription factor [Paenibacillus crassostreae]|uniref:metalloregulator ArsR/SmtB family transcription factor n=1 Tax=Paenibacillus crassostreae TaxID=1763538 RepID=UPI00083880EC|nr:metalloregulator ArsR/SmtB family transcription factor [Paenibacillus crassostreae]AOZ90892.1 hypothetical protein LPB68_00840 [Paenibacillus crassostreae]
MNDNNQSRDVFDAIADPTRRRLIYLLAEAEEIPLHELTAQFQMGRTAVSKHLTILKEAGLVLDRKVGRETRFRLNASPLKETVTLTLQDLGGGKVNLHLEQSGFSNTQGLEGAKYGWSAWCIELEKVLEQ